ncbi:MAG TPA: hypothetical protein VNX28_08960, partial [Gemmataceae bacterium]|nr:hypothetical protein [Gemmataceae bacterium]
MRTFGRLLVVVSLAMAVSQSSGQPGGPGGKGLGGQAFDRMTLFQNPQVRAELKVTDEQLARLPAATLKALAEVLNAKQLQRLRGIYLQQRGDAAFLETDVKEELKISPEQVKAIQAALEEQSKGQKAMMAAGGFDPAKMQELQNSTSAKIQSALSGEQKTAWSNLLGKPFQLAGGFGGGKGGKGGKGLDAGTGKATPAERIKVAKDFKVELLYTVPRAVQGSWVSMCVGPRGQLIVSDQGGAGLFRVIPPPIGGRAADTKVEKLPAQISGAQGLLWAFDSLYVMTNGGGKGGQPNGLYRVKASRPGGELDSVQHLATVPGGGEHGPHAVLLAPDGKALYCVCGNDTKLFSPLAGSMLPKIWGDDLLFPYIARFSGVVPPAGCIYRVDPDGKNWELWSAGYRNPYDAAFNRHGDLFTFDSDMEWDMNTPWYRLTRIMMAASGSDFGFRNGSNVSPPRYPDTLPAIKDIGPGSPTGVAFGYGAKFPAKYQEAFYISDWSYGRLFAVHLTPDGSAYKAQVEEFATGAPLALTDLVVNPQDGALYFTVGGRNTQSALYRITYTGNEPTAPSKGDSAGAEARALRHQLEAFHGKVDAKAVQTAWPYLGHADRYIR